MGAIRSRGLLIPLTLLLLTLTLGGLAWQSSLPRGGHRLRVDGPSPDATGDEVMYHHTRSPLTLHLIPRIWERPPTAVQK